MGNKIIKFTKPNKFNKSNKPVKKTKIKKTGPSMEIKDILEKANEIDTDKIAKEMLTWLINNVENFIDNQKREFKIDLILDSDTMSESTKLQNLYRAIPEEDTKSIELDKIDNISDIESNRFLEVNKCRKALDKITKKCHSSMKWQKELLEMLFKRMIFYYEMVGVSKGNVLLKELTGAVSITEFDYEAFSVNVQLSSAKVGIQRENEMEVVEVGKEREYDIPEGFAIWLEIAFKDTIQRPNLF